MTATKTLSGIIANQTFNMSENIAFTNDPASSSLQRPVSSGAQYQFDGNRGPLANDSWHGTVTLTAGAATLDLTNLTDAILGAGQTMSGKKLRRLEAWTPPGNAGVLNIAPGASNPYTGWATGLIVGKGDQQILGPLNSTIAVDGTHKTLDFSGTGTDSVNLLLLFGP